jgi:ubiquinone/menaquinone biosynthesis C-methylase UbiE
MEFAIEVFLFLCCGIVVFFFLTTRASMLLAHRLRLGNEHDRHVYWIYRHPFLIWLIDRQFIADAILLFQYRRLVKRVVGPACDVCRGKRVLQVSCAFGDFTLKLAGCCHRLGELYIFDLVHSEVTNVSRKLARVMRAEGCHFFRGDAAALPLPAAAFDYVVSFFLFHELPPGKKQRVFDECLRTLKPGGLFIYGEFHRPSTWLGRFWGRFIFTVFEPYAQAMWEWDPGARLDPGAWSVRRETLFGGYFQVTFIQALTPPRPLAQAG